jgi:hypothetical protein
VYLRKLRVRNIKLLRDVEIDFTRDGNPRPWTAFIGENGLCKTALLQAIALAASGPDRANQLADVPSLHDARHLHERAEIEAEFGFGERMHATRVYPGLSPKPDKPPHLESRLWLEPGWRVFQGSSRYLNNPQTSPEHDPLREARARGLPGWFVAGYGTTRALPKAAPGGRPEDLVVGRLDTLFERGALVALNFSSHFSQKMAFGFATALLQLLEGEAGQMSILSSPSGLSLHYPVEPQAITLEALEELPFEFKIRLPLAGGDLLLPATAASQGLQSTIAWVSDLVGHQAVDNVNAMAALRSSPPTHFSEYDLNVFEGLVLLDELDLHLHPSWQLKLIPALKNAFPHVQFVTTTHSPMMLPGLEQDEILRLRQLENGDVGVEAPKASPALMTGSELYDTFFEIRKLYPNPLGDKLHQYGYLANDPTRSDEEDATMRTLRRELEAAGVTFDWEPAEREPGA